jgi:hypothetical protein
MFCPCDDGSVRSLTEVLGRHEPVVLRRFLQIIRVLASHRLRPALQFALAGNQEVAL